MSFSVYILYSANLDRYYIGSTSNIESRLIKHLQSKHGFTSRTEDWKLMHSESFGSRNEALKRETQIKKWKSRKMVEALISSEK